VQANFKQVSPEEYQQRLEAAAWPEHVVLSMSQLSSIVGSGVNYFESNDVIRARDVFTHPYDPADRTCADTGIRSSIRLTSSRPGRNMSRERTGAAFCKHCNDRTVRITATVV
jgi:hypothetical protein